MVPKDGIKNHVVHRMSWDISAGMKTAEYYDRLNGHRLGGGLRADLFVVYGFRALELGCECCGMIRMMPGFPEHLAMFRMEYAKPVVVISCCRCHAHNKDIGGHARSSHLCDKPTPHTTPAMYGACGVDIDNPTKEMILLLEKMGWSIGIWGGMQPSMIHADRLADYSKRNPGQRLFFYPGISLADKNYWYGQLEMYGKIK